MKIIILGKNGMLGNYIFKYLSKYYDVYGVTRDQIDFKDSGSMPEKFQGMFALSDEDLVVNCVGTIKPRCDQLGPINAISINSILPHILANDSTKRGYKLIHPTTDCIYSGKTGNYTEESSMDVTDIYGVSKYMGENENSTNLRVSIIGEEINNKRSLVEWCKTLEGKCANGFTDHHWNGVTCLTYAKIINKMITENIWWKGTRHALSPKAINKYDLVKLITDTFKIKVNLKSVDSGSTCNRTLQTKHLENSRFKVPELQEQIEEMKEFSNLLHSR